MGSTLQGLHRWPWKHEPGCCNPFRVGISFAGLSQGSLRGLGNPWAGRWNPVGIKKTALESGAAAREVQKMVKKVMRLPSECCRLDGRKPPVERYSVNTDKNESTLRPIGDAWSSVRGLLQQAYSTKIIKGILGKAGLQTIEIQYDGTYVEPLLAEADKLFRAWNPDSRNRFVIGCIEEVVAFESNRAAKMSGQRFEPDNQILRDLEKVLARVGYGLSGSDVFPLALQLDVEAASLPGEVGEAIAEALRRYRDGGFAGAITSICGAVDKITEEVFSAKCLGDSKEAKYQERVSKAFGTFETQYRSSLEKSGTSANEIKLIWDNHKKAVSNAAYVLAAFRREHSDAHGQQKSPKEFVQKSMDCAVFILRSFCSVLK